MKSRSLQLYCRSGLWTIGFQAAALWLTVLMAFTVSGFQKPGGRDPGTPAIPSGGVKPGTSTGTGGREIPRRPGPAKLTPVADLKIVAPPDCRLFLNGQEINYGMRNPELTVNGRRIKIEYSADSGHLTLKRLKADSYVVEANRANYKGYREQIDLKSGEANVVTVTLVPLPGSLTVSPDVHGSEIALSYSESGVTLGRFTNRLSGVELPPGQYRVSMTKDGYEPESRDVNLHAGESIYIEPQLKRLPPPAPPPPPKRTAVIIPARATLERDGKYFIVRISGASGDTSKTLGTLNVTIGSSGATISGLLTGLPCRVQFIQLENVAEGSLAEAPGPSSQWSEIVIRIRPKNSKRPINFAINWTLLPDSSLTIQSDQRGSFRAAAVIVSQSGSRSGVVVTWTDAGCEDREPISRIPDRQFGKWDDYFSSRDPVTIITLRDMTSGRDHL